MTADIAVLAKDIQGQFDAKKKQLADIQGKLDAKNKELENFKAKFNLMVETKDARISALETKIASQKFMEGVCPK